MAFNLFRPATPPIRAHVIRVTPVIRLADGAPYGLFVVLASDAGAALAAVVAGLGLGDTAEVTGEVLAPAATARLDLEPGRPLRLP